MSLNVRQLQIVLAVSRSGSVTTAAEALGISQPAVSMMLRSSAEAAGFPLFRRKQGRLQPTAETKVLIAELERVFDGIERINRLVGDMRDTNVGSVQVASTATLADNVLALAVAEFQRSRPQIQVTIRTTDIPSVVASVVQEHVDFGLILSPSIQHEARALELCKGQLVAVVHPGHPLAGRGVIGPADIAPHPLISFSRAQPLGVLVEQAFRRAGVARRISLEVNQSSAACALARAGAGVAVVDPFWLVANRDRRVVALRFRPRTEVTAQILVARNASLSRPARLLLATLRKIAGRPDALA